MFKRTAYIDIAGSRFEGLRFVFNVEKSLVGYPNKANIKIYNLSEKSRQMIEEDNLKVQLYAGHEDTETVLLFDGDIVNVVHIKQGVDWISEIYSADGIKILSQSTINKTLPAGVDTSRIYNELVGQMKGISKGVTEGLKNCLSGKRSLLRELQLSGNVKDWLDKIAADCGFEYSINDGVIETVTKGLPVSDEPPVIINQSTGMFDSPERTEIGVNVKTILKPSLKLGRTIKIEAITEKLNIGNLFFRDADTIRNTGIYRIDKLIHIGDTHSNAWETNIQARVF